MSGYGANISITTSYVYDINEYKSNIIWILNLVSIYGKNETFFRIGSKNWADIISYDSSFEEKI